MKRKSIGLNSELIRLKEMMLTTCVVLKRYSIINTLGWTQNGIRVYFFQGRLNHLSSPGKTGRID